MTTLDSINAHVLCRLEELLPSLVASVDVGKPLDFYCHIGRNRFLACLSTSLLGLDISTPSIAEAEHFISRYLFTQSGAEVGSRAPHPHIFESALRHGQGTFDDLLRGVIHWQLCCCGHNLAFGSPCFDAYALGGLLELSQFIQFLGLPKPLELGIFFVHLQIQLEKTARYKLELTKAL